MGNPYHLNPGDRLFASTKPFSDLGPIFGIGTHLFEVLEVHFPKTTCVCCGGEIASVEYDVKILDSEDVDKIGVTGRINNKNVNASRFQAYAGYFGRWMLSAPEKYVEPLSLMKRIDKPDYYDMQETPTLLHFIFPSTNKSVIVPKLELIFMENRDRVVDNYDKLTAIRYGTIGCDGDGGKIKGWMFEFTDENLNFTV